MTEKCHEKGAFGWLLNKQTWAMQWKIWENTPFLGGKFKWTTHSIILSTFTTKMLKINFLYSSYPEGLSTFSNLMCNRYITTQLMTVDSVNFDNSLNHHTVTILKSNNLPLQEIHLFDSWMAQYQSFHGMADKYSHEHGAKAKTKYPCQLKRHSHLLSPDSHI